MNQNQPGLKPHEQPISFDDLQPANVPVEPPKPTADEPVTSPSSPPTLSIAEKALDLARAEPVAPPPPTPGMPEAPTKEVKVVEPEETSAQLPVPKKQVQTTQAPAQPVAATATVPVTEQKSEVRKEIESILQQGLTDMYLHMPPAERTEFSKAANETAGKLETLVAQFTATAKEVLKLIRAWLIKIPKINTYFLEQASKIKTDEILEMQKQKKKQARLLH